jgi:HAD superfamily hydrolase (TIGR01549 family)
MTIKTVIFDLDGTITQPFLDFDAIRKEMDLSDGAGSILEAMEEMSPDEKREAEDILFKHENRAVEESLLNEGAEKTLKALRDAGINIGILTRNKRCNAEAVAARHDLEFDAIVDREDGPVKPDAFGVLRLCEHFGTDGCETIVVGDYLYDLLSAKAAKATAVLLKNHKNAEEFSKFADYVITSLDELLKIVDNINSNAKGSADEE